MVNDLRGWLWEQLWSQHPAEKWLSTYLDELFVRHYVPEFVDGWRFAESPLTQPFFMFSANQQTQACLSNA